MAINWDEIILVQDEDTVNAIGGKTLMKVAADTNNIYTKSQIDGFLSDIDDELSDKANTTDLGTMASQDDAESDGNEYVRKNGAWAISSGGGGSSSMATDVSYYVDTSTGSDSNTGAYGYPFQTITKAITEGQKALANTVTIYIANGSYNESISISGGSKTFRLVLQGDVSITGNLHNVLISSGANVYLNASSGSTKLSVTDTSKLITVTDGSRFVVNMGTIETGKIEIRLGSIVKLSNIVISGDGVIARGGSLVYIDTATITATTGLTAAGSIIMYGSLSGTMTNQTSTSNGGRILTGAQQ